MTTNARRIDFTPLIQALRSRIKDGGLKLRQVEEESGVDASTLSRLLTSEGKQGIDVNIVAALARWTGTSLDTLCEIKEPDGTLQKRLMLENCVTHNDELTDEGREFLRGAVKLAFKHFNKRFPFGKDK